MVAHEIITPVRAVMHSRGMSAFPTCPQPGCGAPESVRHLCWECSTAGDQWATAGSLQFPYLPAGEVLTANLVLYAVSQKNQLPSDFPKQWLSYHQTFPSSGSDQYCWTELDQSVSGKIIAATILSKIAKTLKFLYRYTHLFNTKVKKLIQ